MTKKIGKKYTYHFQTTIQLLMSLPNYQLYQCLLKLQKNINVPLTTNKKIKMTINFFSIRQKYPYNKQKK
jgi:hypothetical protein